MPSTSKSQQRLFGWALACKRGESERCPVNVQKLADEMSEEELDKYASTSHDDLPNKVRESMEDCVEMMENEDFDYFEETIMEAEKINDVPPVSKDVKTPPPAQKPFAAPPGYENGKNSITPSLFKLPGSNKKKDDRRIMDFAEFLKRINYRTHDDTLQKGHGQNRSGGGRPALPSNIP